MVIDLKKEIVKKIFASFFGLTLISSLFFSCSSVKNQIWEEDEIINEDYSKFIKDVDSYLKEKDFQGSVLVGKNKTLVFAKGYALLDEKNPDSGNNTIQTTYEIGSITKQMTATAIMKLIHEGKLSLDDKMTVFFPTYVYGDKITVDMLLTMHSGLFDHINSPYDYFDRKTASLIEKAEKAGAEVDRDLVLTALYTAPLFAEPNSTYFYCNTDYYILSKIIEIVSGQKYEDYIQQNIFSVCGMTSSNIQFQNTTAKGYDRQGKYISIPANIALGCGDVNSNVLDLFKWNYSFFNGKVIEKKIVNKMINADSYGYGFYIGKGIALHGGSTDCFNSYSSYVLNKKLSIIVLVNRPITESSATIIAGKINKMWESYTSEH